MSNLTQRILVALVAIPLMVFLTLMGGWYFFAMVVFIASLGLHEFYKLAEKKGAKPQTLLGLLFGFIIISLFMWKNIGLQGLLPEVYLFVIVFLIFGVFTLTIELFRNNGSALLNTSATMFGVAYVSLFLGSLVGIRQMFASDATGDFGGATIITIFVSIWMCDSLAYFAGRMLGKHKLFERVSPNKTWEGAIAGYVGAVAAFVVAQQFVLAYMTPGEAIVCGSVIGILGQIGDLAESLLKRDAGVKDSSSIIPGHGGVLDRFDSLIFVSPLLYVFLLMVL